MRNKPLAAAKVQAYADTNGVPTQIESNHTNQGQRHAVSPGSHSMNNITNRSFEMNDLTVNKNKLTESQIGFVLNDIASTAKAIIRFSLMLMAEGDPRETEAMAQAIKTMAQRIGLLSDAAAENIPSCGGVVVSATFDGWMMPPGFHEEAST